MQGFDHLLEPPPVLRLRVLAADQEGRACAVTVLRGARAAWCAGSQAADVALPVPQLHKRAVMTTRPL